MLFYQPLSTSPTGCRSSRVRMQIKLPPEFIFSASVSCGQTKSERGSILRPSDHQLKAQHLPTQKSEESKVHRNRVAISAAAVLRKESCSIGIALAWHYGHRHHRRSGMWPKDERPSRMSRTKARAYTRLHRYGCSGLAGYLYCFFDGCDRIRNSRFLFLFFSYNSIFSHICIYLLLIFSSWTAPLCSSEHSVLRAPDASVINWSFFSSVLTLFVH